MKRTILLAALAGLAWIPFAQKSGAAYGQNLLEENPLIEPASVSVSPDSPDGKAYADGMRAINDGRWSDAIRIFSQFADQSGDHAGGALYWKAYAENKVGQSTTALEDCGKLRHDYPGSKWLDECGALEIEIHAKSGQPIQPNAQQSDDLKLLALASLMQHDEKRALAQIDEILNTDSSSEKLKQGALFIMGEHHSDTVFPQIVRISYVEGDVRISRDLDKKHTKDSDWEKAVADLPLENGFSLVTGNGRAEIEFENASTLYLGENSVLTFNDLYTTGGVPHTELALLTGTVTLHIRPYVSGEWFMLHMPTDSLVSKYPEVTDLRVSSYTDGIAITCLGKGSLGLSGANHQQLILGKTYYFKDGRPTIDAGPIQAPDFSEWDKWVADRYTARTAATAEMLKASGLTAPIPGLADMQGQGQFVDCEPYGTCWQPAETHQEVSQATPPEPKPGEAEQALQTEAQATGDQNAKPARDIRFIGTPSPTAPAEWLDLENMFPCIPAEVQALYIRSLYRANTPPAYFSAAFPPSRWAWAVCHSGSWIYRRNRYMWVVGKRHHHAPIHWVKYGNKVAFVPTHPHDVKDRPPVNRKNPGFAINTKNGHPIERIEFPIPHSVELLKEPPKGFRTAYVPPLAHVGEPHMEAHQLKEMTVAKGTPVKTTPISFDHKSQSFMMAHQEMHGTRSVTVTAPMNNHSGTLQAHGGGAGGGFSGHGGGGTGHGGGASGGGSHGGGSSASSGGGSHGGGGSSSGSSGGSSGASSGGGSHH